MFNTHTKAVNFALNNIEMSECPQDQLPVKVVELIKKWVAKDKTLINNAVQNLIVSENADEQKP